MCQQLRHASASVAHTQHIAQIYIERLVIEENTKASWLLRSAVLLQRSRQEQRRSRVQQRAFLQMQELLDGFDARHGIAPEDSRVAEAGNATSATTTAALDVAKVGATRLQRTRAPYLYAIAWPAVWQLRNEFAEQCFEDNLFKTALDLYEHTMDWPNIIKCCQKLDRRNKAANLARDLLEDDPHDAMLWVALGEATRDEAHLWKAWEVCERKMAAPMRALARLALERERYEDVTKYFDMSVSVNPIFGGDWFALGYASLRTKKGDRACEAFTRVCQLDPEDAYAWTNLGALLLEKKQARPAFNALSQALRNNRMSWKMWDNYLQVAVELLEITESSHSYNILLNMAPRTYPMDGVILGKFVAGCLRYIQGDIYSTQNDEALARDALEAAALEATGGKANTTDLNAEDEALLAEAGVAPVAAPTPAPANAPTAIIETRVEASRSGPEAVLTIASNGGGEQTSSVFDTLKIAPFRTAPKMMDAVESAVAGEAAVTSVSAAGIGAGFGRALAGVGEDDEAEDGVFEMAELQPFFAEFDDVDPAIYKTAYQTSKSVSEDVRQRFTNRTRELLTRIASVYHDSPAVHACNATFFGTLDGPAAAFDHRVKELRERTAVNLWERDEEKFRGVVQCLEALVVAAVAPPLPSTGEAAAVAGSQSATEEAAAGGAMATATIATRKKAAQQHISHVLEVTQSHMETNQLYRKLQALSMKLKRAKD
jgi:tetratricopeptide (TPR) repeat protein